MDESEGEKNEQWKGAVRCVCKGDAMINYSAWNMIESSAVLVSHSCVLDCNLGHHIQRAAMRLSPVSWLDKSLVASAWLPKPAVGSFKVASYHQHNLHHPNDYDGHHSRPLNERKLLLFPKSALATLAQIRPPPHQSTPLRPRAGKLHWRIKL